MKLRTRHLIAGVVVVAVVGVFAAVIASGRNDSKHLSTGDPDQDFLLSVRAQASSIAPSDDPTIEPGTMPPIDEKQEEKGDRVPVIQVETDHYNIGLIDNDKPAHGQVMIYNKGTWDLTIANVETSCACTEGSIDVKKIPPGGEAPMHVVVIPGRISDFEATRTLSIYSSDPRNPITKVQISATIKPEFTVEPRSIDFGTVAKGDTALQQAIVRQVQADLNPGGLSDEQLIISRVAPVGLRPDELKLSVAPRPESEWAKPGMAEYLVTVALDTTELAAGPLNTASYYIETNVERVRNLGARVTANITAPYTLSPRPVTISMEETATSSAATVRVKATEPVRVANLVIGGDGRVFTCEAQPDADANAANVVITVDPHAPPGVAREQLTFDVIVGDKTYYEKVPVTAAISASRGRG